MNKSTETLYSY